MTVSEASGRLAEEHAALRRVATLVARHVPAGDLLDAVAREVGTLMRGDTAAVVRYEPDGTATIMGAHHARRAPGERFAPDADYVVAAVRRTARAARFDTDDPTSLDMPDAVRNEGIRSGVGSPIMVDGQLWGTITIASLHGSLPAASEQRLGDFTELVATAIANAAARAEVGQLAQEHAALRRVATLVAQGAPSSKLFDAVAREVGTLLGGDFAGLARFDDGFAVPMGAWAAEGEHPPMPPRWPMQPGDPATAIEEAPVPTRWADWADVPGPIAAFFREIGVRSSVGTPIVVDGRLWGALALHSKCSAPFPPDTETRMQEFTDLVGTAIANAQARGELSELAREQAALRRVATLVAEGAGPEELFRAVGEEVAKLLGCEQWGVIRFDGDGRATVMAADAGGPHAAGTRVEPVPEFVTGAVRDTGRSARFDTDESDAPDMPEIVRELSVHSAVGSPVVVEGELWGTIVVASPNRRLPATAERRLSAFTELVATAVANTQTRAQAGTLADEQAALRRVATLVAREASAEEVLTAIAEECGRLFGTEDIAIDRYEGDHYVVLVVGGAAADMFPVGSEVSLDGGDAVCRVYRTGAPVRIEDVTGASATPVGEHLRSLGLRAAVATPIIVEDRLWGAMAMATTRPEPLPPDTESRLGQFTELMATAIANTESRARVDRLTEEQAALRRLATLVAQGAPLDAVFAKVGEEVARTLGEVDTALWRDDGDGTVTAVAARGPSLASGVPVGTRLTLDGDSVIARALRNGGPHRIDDYAQIAGSVAERARALRMRSAVGCPIVVGSRPWGAMTVATYEAEPFAAETETRVMRFSELVATAIANTEARAEVRRLAEAQAALRRVATLVAKEASLPDVFARVAEEASRALGDVDCRLYRDDGDGAATLVALNGSDLGPAHGVGTRRATRGDSTIGHALRTGRPSRVDDYATAVGPSAALARSLGIRASLACPIFVGERVWGVIQVTSFDQAPIPLEVETRIMRFSELVATAIANTDARAEVERLAEEQAALRRVATLVAQGAPAGAVFDTVAAEIRRLLAADHVVVCRYEPGSQLTVVARRAPDGEAASSGMRVSHAGDSVEAVVRRTERPARVESFAGGRGRIAEWARSVGVRVAVGTPIVVDGRLWGVVSAGWSGDESPPADTEPRMAQFGQLLDTAIANADSRDQLTASRARLMTAGDEARRRVVRDLHDGAQQALVHAIVTLKLAQRALREDTGGAGSLLDDALSHAELGNQELRELAHGILPSVLTHGGLRAAVRSLATRLDLPVRVHVPKERFPAEVEASAYFIVAEALTNVVKHARAEGADVSATVVDGMLRVEVGDDGHGGADPGGHGLVGMSDRVAALGGRLHIDSPPGSGTRITASLPLAAAG